MIRLRFDIAVEDELGSELIRTIVSGASNSKRVILYALIISRAKIKELKELTEATILLKIDVAIDDELGRDLVKIIMDGAREGGKVVINSVIIGEDWTK